MRCPAACIAAAVLLAAAILASAPLHASAAGPIEVSEEFPLLGSGTDGGIQGQPHAAWGGGTYLAVWREGWHGKGGGARILAARVSPGGRVADARGIEVAPHSDRVQERPRAAFCGGVFLVVWQELVNGKDYDVLAARVTHDGRVLDAPPIRIAGGPHNQVLPEVASDGKTFLVVWQAVQGEETAYRGFAAVVDADGKVGPPVETGAAPQPKIAWNGRAYLAAYGMHSVESVILGSDGRRLVPGPRGTETIRSTKPAAFSLTGLPGRGWLVIGHRAPPDPWGWGGPGAMRAALLDNEGRLENGDAVKEPAGNWQRLPGWLDVGREKKPGATWPWGVSACAWTGKYVLAVWPRHHLGGEKFTNLENCDLLAARLDGYRSLDEAGIPLAAGPGDETRPALASDGAGRLLCIYENHDRAGRDLVAACMVSVP